MIAHLNHRLDAIRRRSRRDYWTGMVAIVGHGLVLVPFVYAAWRLFCAP